MFDNSEYASGSVNYFCKKLNLGCLFGFWIRLWLKVVFSFGRNSESNYIDVLEASWLGNLKYFLKYMLELSYRNKYKIPAKYLRMSHFKNVETKTKKWFQRNFWEKLFSEMISYTIKFHSKNIPEQLYSGRVLL